VASGSSYIPDRTLVSNFSEALYPFVRDTALQFYACGAMTQLRPEIVTLAEVRCRKDEQEFTTRFISNLMYAI
jgi:hypothetical protein